MDYIDRKTTNSLVAAARQISEATEVTEAVTPFDPAAHAALQKEIAQKKTLQEKYTLSVRKSIQKAMVELEAAYATIKKSEHPSLTNSFIRTDRDWAADMEKKKTHLRSVLTMLNDGKWYLQ